MLGVIIVAYKNPDRTVDYILHQLSKLKQEYVTVVVNNESTFEECQDLAAKCHGVACMPTDKIGRHNLYVVCSDKNLGFAKANNLGVRFLANNYPCEFLLFSNDDIILNENTDLGDMMTFLTSENKIGAIGPAVVGLDGEHQSPHRRVVTAYRQIGWKMFSKFRRKRSEEVLESQLPAEGYCYWVSGAFFLMRYDDFFVINGFDPATFLYGEEPILAERLKRIGKKMYYYPKIQVTHLEGATTKKAMDKNRLYHLIVESNSIYYRKYLHTPRVVVALYKWLNKDSI